MNVIKAKRFQGAGLSGTVTNLDFTSGATAATSAPSLVYNLPSFLDPNYTGSFSTSIGSYPLSGTANISAGLSGGITLTLGQYTPNIPVSINMALPANVTDGQVFTVDPTLVGATDASFSLMGPGANVNLDLGLNGQVSLHVNQGSSIGASINLTVPLSFGYTLKAGTSVSIGPGSLTVSEPTSGTGTSQAGTALGSLPTLSSSVTSGTFLAASVDLIQTLAYFLPDGLGNLINGNPSIGVGGFTYSLLSAPLAASLAISDTVTITPGSIGVSIAEISNGATLTTDTGTLGQNFSFTAPSTGAGNLTLETTYTLNYVVSSVYGLVGNLSLTLNGPQASLTGLGGTIASVGPLFTDQLFSYSAGLGTTGRIGCNCGRMSPGWVVAYSFTPSQKACNTVCWNEPPCATQAAARAGMP